MYRHTQVGTLMLALFGAAELGLLVLLMYKAPDPALKISLGLMPLLALLFGWLTVEVDGSRLRWSFGAGLIRKSRELIEIENAEAVRNSWIWGWGIRLTPHGWLYNVSGFDAVEVTLTGGKKFRIGTDDPQGLLRAIQLGTGR